MKKNKIEKTMHKTSVMVSVAAAHIIMPPILDSTNITAQKYAKNFPNTIKNDFMIIHPFQWLVGSSIRFQSKFDQFFFISQEP